jgi:hypothetical protein
MGQNIGLKTQNDNRLVRWRVEGGGGGGGGGGAAPQPPKPNKKKKI